MIELRKWQKEALERLENSINKSGIVEATTGSGKTVIGLKLIEENRDKRFLITVPTTHLMYQWKKEIEDKIGYGVNVVLLGDGHKSLPPSVPCVVIAVINSVRNINWDHPLAKFDIFIADEVHRYASKENAKVFHGTFGRKIGLTATLERSDGMQTVLHKYIGPTVYTLDNQDAKEAGYVCDYDIECVKCIMTQTERAQYILMSEKVRKYMSIFNNNFQEMHRNFRSGPRTSSYRSALEGMKSVSHRKAYLTRVKSKKDIAINLCIKNQNKKIILFDEIQESANDLYNDLKNRGMNPVIYHSGIKGKDKKKAIEDFIIGNSKILVTVKALDEGLDVKDVEVGIIVNGNSQKRQAIQRLGRLLRKKEGKVSKLYMLYVPETKDEDYVKKRIIAFGKSPRDVLITTPHPIVDIQDFI